MSSDDHYTSQYECVSFDDYFNYFLTNDFLIYLVEYLWALAIMTLLGVIVIKVLTSNQSQSCDNTKDKGLRQFLLAMPYTLFLFALASLVVVVAIKRKPHVLGCTTGTLLAQLLCLVVMGGIVAQVLGMVDPLIVWQVTSGIIVVVLAVLSVLCAYPKVSV